MLLAKFTSVSLQPSILAATGANRARICAVAFMMAAPLMSAPLDADVADALGTFWVSVPVTRT